MDYFFVTVSAILLILGAVGVYKNYSISLSITNTLLFIGIQLIRGRKIEIPNNFPIFTVFFTLLLIHSLYYGGSIFYILLFLSGGLYWLVAYNLRHRLTTIFPFFLIFLGIFMAGLFILSNVKGVAYLSPGNLFLPISELVRHNHMGDLWALILVIIIYKMSVKIKSWHFALTLVGITLILLSNSRSAIVSLAVGGIYLYYNTLDRKKLRRMFVFALVVLTLLFLYVSINKTTLLSRPYFEQAIGSLVNSPAGTGVGNFYKVSKQSSLTHNIVLEIVSGMGVFSVMFILWLVKVFRSLLKKNTNILYKALFFAIFVNFCFDTTYNIPTMLWIWFSTLALIFI